MGRNENGPDHFVFKLNIFSPLYQNRLRINFFTNSHLEIANVVNRRESTKQTTSDIYFLIFPIYMSYTYLVRFTVSFKKTGKTKLDRLVLPM